MPRIVFNYKGIFLTTFNKIKKNAEKRKIPFSITIEYIGDLFEKQNGYCVLTGLKLELKKNVKDNTQTASLDRKDSAKGYIIGNLQWIHKKINRIKIDFPENEFIELCYQVVRYQEQKKVEQELTEKIDTLVSELETLQSKNTNGTKKIYRKIKKHKVKNNIT